MNLVTFETRFVDDCVALAVSRSGQRRQWLCKTWILEPNQTWLEVFPNPKLGLEPWGADTFARKDPNFCWNIADIAEGPPNWERSALKCFENEISNVVVVFPRCLVCLRFDLSSLTVRVPWALTSLTINQASIKPLVNLDKVPNNSAPTFLLQRRRLLR